MRISTKIRVAQCWFFYLFPSTQKNRLFGPHFRHSNDNYISHTKKNVERKSKDIIDAFFMRRKMCACDPAYRSIRVCNGAMPVLSPTTTFRDNDLHMEVNTAEWPCSFTLHCVTLGDYYRNWLFLPWLFFTLSRLLLCPISQKLHYELR